MSFAWQVAKRCNKISTDVWVRTERCDLSDPGSIDALAARVLDHHGGVDVLVCNAGISQGNQNVLEGDPADWNATMHVNVDAPMRLTRLIAPDIVRRGPGGACLFTGSLAGYHATKNAPLSALERQNKILELFAGFNMPRATPEQMITRLTAPQCHERKVAIISDAGCANSLKYQYKCEL